MPPFSAVRINIVAFRKHRERLLSLLPILRVRAGNAWIYSKGVGGSGEPPTFPGPHQLSLNDMIIARVDDYCGDRPLPEYPAKLAVSQ
ncbi:hypothetical protein WN51_13834 [Melipona quadrifasciata]|uniref:Uncharacterized protein n=1 Tax=Melipona quadrifasciata TaxID=166423 RepID=A0A0M9A0C5_9HYME|nr:hypothetical protein WN51_13834 [Melipona quadrifasciata]